ncbi:MAG: tetratricopeptide repeat protein, partial [Desulfomonile tiedjei]|nr:tetratricopeptide repeat protein [Desulfomonile tiedjei]
MFRFLLPIVLIFLLMGYPSHCGAADWVFKGQPKDGCDSYHSAEAGASARGQQAKLLDDCDAMMQKFPSSWDPKSFLEPAMKRSAILGLSSCGLVYGVDHQQEKSNVCLNRALELAQLLGDSAEQARILNNFGIVHALWGQLVIALDYHGKSLSLSTGTADQVNQVISYNQIGQIAMFMGDYRKASEALGQSLALQAKTSDNVQTCLTLDNLGHLNEAWGNHDRALECYGRALELKKKLGLTGGEVASYVLLGRTYRLLGKHDAALSFFQKGLELCKKRGYPTDLVVDHIGDLYLDRGDAQKAEEYVKRAGFWQSLGRLYLIRGDFSAAASNYV